MSYIIQGRIIDRSTRRGLAGATVAAQSNGTTYPEARTDASGHFILRLNGANGKPASEALPELQVQVSADGQLLATASDAIRWNANGRGVLILEVDSPAASPSGLAIQSEPGPGDNEWDWNGFFGGPFRSALGQNAYFYDLVSFVITAFNTDFPDRTAIDARFYRVITGLSYDRAALEQEVHQVELANEVLENYLLWAYSYQSRSDIYVAFSSPQFPQPNVLNRIFDSYLDIFNLQRAPLASAFRAAYPPTGSGDRRSLDALLSRAGLVENDLTQGLGLSNTILVQLEQWSATIEVIDRFPALVRQVMTRGIDSSDPFQAPRHVDALARAEQAIARVKDFTLADLRANLLYTVGFSDPDEVKYLGNYLHIDLAMESSARTTRLASAIEALQSLVNAFLLEQEYLILTIERADLEARWRWLQSYSLWHAAQSVFFYPENFLLPDVRPNRTPQFQTLLEQVQDATPAQMRAAVAAYEASIAKLSRTEVLAVAVLNDRMFLFGYAERGQLCWTEQSSDGNWVGWRVLSLPGERLIDAVVFNERIYLLFYPAANDQASFEFSWLDPDQGSPAPITSTGRLVYNNDQIGNVWGFAAGPEHLAVYFTLLGQGNTLYSGVMDRFGGWRPAVLQSRDNPIDRFVRVLGHSGGNDYLLTSDPSNLWVVRVERPNGSIWEPPQLHYQKIASHSVVGGRYDQFMGTVLNQQLIVRYSVAVTVNNVMQYPLHQLAIFAPGAAPSWHNIDSNNLHPSTGGLLRATSTVLRFYDGLGFYLFDLNNGVPSYRAVATHSFQRALPLARHPLGNNGALVEQYVQQQTRSYYNGTRYDFVLLILDEWYFHIPLAIAQALTATSAYRDAIQWLQTVWNPYTNNRMLWEGYYYYRDWYADTRNNPIWLRDPFNPHYIARIRPEAYLKYTLFQYVDLLLDWADNEFARDTAEAISRARELYELADNVLSNSYLRRNRYALAWQTLTRDIYARHTPDQVRVLQFMLAPVRRGELQMGYSEIMVMSRILREDASFQQRVLELKAFLDNPTGFALPSSPAVAPSDDPELRPALRLVARLAAPRAKAVAAPAKPSAAKERPATPQLAASYEVNLIDAMAIRLNNGFDAPSNTYLNTIFWRIDSNLEKIRTGRNYAGMRRNLRAYAPPADPLGLVQQANSGENSSEETLPSEPPPLYRFSYLIERARFFVVTAQQLESLLLASFEKSDEAEYSLIKARQDVRAAQSNIALQGLRIREANTGIQMAQLQKERSTIQLGYFTDLLDNGLLAAEKEALDRLWSAHDWTIAASAAGSVNPIAKSVASFITGDIVGGLLGAADAAEKLAQSMASIQSIASQARSLQASYERRAQEWAFQKRLADQDIKIGDMGINLANDQLAIVQQEEAIARLQSEFAAEVVNFLGTKFTNKQLYDWMGRVLRRYYRDHLNFATVTARMAQRALAFERQETLSFIAPYYAEREKRDLLVAERLLTDINRLDQHRLSTEKRRKELTKVISLASYAPVEFQRLRSEGWMSFATLMEWFDRDFPGHYMRLIKNVSLTVVGLIPAGEGIKATLANTGVSQVMVGPPFDQYQIIQRMPESIAISAASNGTGLFELRLDDPILLPFEGSGVASVWTLEMPKAANRFDYTTLLDVLLTINYTALDDQSYRTRVVQQLGTQLERVNSFALRYTYADAWYHLNNPIFLADPNDYGFGTGQTLPPYVLEFSLKANDFLPNETVESINRLTLALRQQRFVKVPVYLEFLPDGSNTSYRAAGDIAWDPAQPSSGPLVFTRFTEQRTGNAEWQAVPSSLDSLRPFGRWRIWLRNDAAIDPAAYPGLFGNEPPVYGQRQLDLSWLTDMLFVVGYDSKVEYRFAV